MRDLTSVEKNQTMSRNDIIFDEDIDDLDRIAEFQGLLDKSIRCRSNKMVIPSKNTNDPKVYKAWLAEERVRQRERFAHRKSVPVVAEEKPKDFKKYGGVLIDLSAVTHITTDLIDDTTGVYFRGGGNVAIGKKHEKDLLKDLKFKEE